MDDNLVGEIWIDEDSTAASIDFCKPMSCCPVFDFDTHKQLVPTQPGDVPVTIALIGFDIEDVC